VILVSRLPLCNQTVPAPDVGYGLTVRPPQARTRDTAEGAVPPCASRSASQRLEIGMPKQKVGGPLSWRETSHLS